MDSKTIMEVVMEAACDAKVDEVTMSTLESLVSPEVQTFTPETQILPQQWTIGRDLTQ
jgi:hypothetical protein